MNYFQKILQKILFRILPNLRHLGEDSIDWYMVTNSQKKSSISQKSRINGPYKVIKSDVGDYTYIALNSYIMNTSIGKFCSIGPNLVCGFGVHPINGISTNPMFYSVRKQNGYSLVEQNKIDEVPSNLIGNDVFIGANVTILNGITIGDGAVIGAGSVVSKDIPPYAVAVGAPIKIIKYRFKEETIENLLKIKWWDKDFEELEAIEKKFFEVEKYIKSCL